MNSALKKILNKVVIDNPRDFKGLKPQEKESVLRICRYIGNIIGYDTIRVETQNTDIEFKDKDNYFLEVKTLFYFRGKYGDIHRKIMREFIDILESRKNRFISGFVDNNKLEIISDKKRLSLYENSSTGNIMFSYNNIPNKDIYGKLWDLIEEAAEQLEKINARGRKIIAIDISYYLMDALRPRKQLQEWIELNPEISKRVDGICLFSLDNQKRGGLIYPLTISTQRLKECVKSKVFRQKDPKQDVIFNLQTVIRSTSEKKIYMDNLGRVYADHNYLKELYFSSLELQRQDKNFIKDSRIDRMAFYLNEDHIK